MKMKLDGTVDTYKTRLVARGDNQVEGVYCGDSLSLVAKLATGQLFLAIATSKHWIIHQVDMNNAFLHRFQLWRST